MFLLGFMPLVVNGHPGHGSNDRISHYFISHDYALLFMGIVLCIGIFWAYKIRKKSA